MGVMKSDIAIKTDVFRHIQGSDLDNEVTGVIRKTGKRPAGSKAEDIVISMLANVNGQIQKATVNVNIYVAANVINGQAEEKTNRLEVLCALASNLFEVFHGDNFRAALLEQRVFEVEGANEYVINNKIEYKQLNE
jgi:hypothetical protein